MKQQLTDTLNNLMGTVAVTKISKLAREVRLRKKIRILALDLLCLSFPLEFKVCGLYKARLHKIHLRCVIMNLK